MVEGKMWCGLLLSRGYLQIVTDGVRWRRADDSGLLFCDICYYYTKCIT